MSSHYSLSGLTENVDPKTHAIWVKDKNIEIAKNTWLSGLFNRLVYWIQGYSRLDTKGKVESIRKAIIEGNEPPGIFDIARQLYPQKVKVNLDRTQKFRKFMQDKFGPIEYDRNLPIDRFGKQSLEDLRAFFEIPKSKTGAQYLSEKKGQQVTGDEKQLLQEEYDRVFIEFVKRNNNLLSCTTEGVTAEDLRLQLQQKASTIKELTLQDVSFLPKEIEILSGLETLCLEKPGCSGLPDIFLPHLKTLRIQHSDLFTTLPSSLATMLPRLKELSLASCHNFVDLRGLRSGLRKLDVSGTGVKEFPSLPEKLEELNISGTQVKEFPSVIPDSLKKIFASSTTCSFKNELPAGIEELDLSQTQDIEIRQTDFGAGMALFKRKGENETERRDWLRRRFVVLGVSTHLKLLNIKETSNVVVDKGVREKIEENNGKITTD